MLEKLKSYIFEELIFIDKPEQFSEQDNLFDAGLDSMGIMRLVMFIEEEFGIVLPDNEVEPENLQSLNRLEKWIQSHQ